MKITSVDVFLLNTKPAPGFNLRPIITRVNTDEGIYGYGEAGIAYGSGATAAFNLNLLTRINRELGGHFRLERFKHHAIFNSEEGRIEMYLVSGCKQEIRIDALDLTVPFAEGERIHTENSYKYSLEEIPALGDHNGMRLIHQWFDARKQFSLNLFEISSDGY